MNNPIFFNKDISWLSFNERVRQEARKRRCLPECIKFLSVCKDLQMTRSVN